MFDANARVMIAAVALTAPVSIVKKIAKARGSECSAHLFNAEKPKADADHGGIHGRKAVPPIESAKPIHMRTYRVTCKST